MMAPASMAPATATPWAVHCGGWLAGHEKCSSPPGRRTISSKVPRCMTTSSFTICRSDARSIRQAGPKTPTYAQLAAVAGVSALTLALGMVVPANWVNLRLSAHDVGGAIMPPGMIMDRDTPAEAMIDMAAVDPRDVVARYGLNVRGHRDLAPRIENGVKVFDLETAVIRWTILPGVTVDAYAFNGQAPGPRLRFRHGERVRINVTNRLPESTTVHWHGLILPNVMDGPAHITQEPIAKGELYRYDFTAVQSGNYFYHSHDHVDRQQSLGLYGAMIIDPAADPSLETDHEYTLLLQEWLMREGLTYPAMPMDGGQPNYFTINGRAYPATDTIRMHVGETPFTPCTSTADRSKWLRSTARRCSPRLAFGPTP
jgi:FtsP/CotA-like multicopper oxidase with cupredoxin domain